MSRLHNKKTGMIVDDHYDGRIRELNSEEENWQKVYLEKDPIYGIAEFIKTAAYIVLFLALCFIGYWYGN